MKTIHIITVLAATITGYATAANRAILPHTKLYDEMNNDDKITSPTHSFIIPNNNDDNQYEEAVVNVATIAEESNTADRQLKGMIRALLDMKKGKSNKSGKHDGDDIDIDAKILMIKGRILAFSADLAMKGYVGIEVPRKVFVVLLSDELEELEEVNTRMVGLGLLEGKNSGRRQLQAMPPTQEDLELQFYSVIGTGLGEGLSFELVTSTDYLVSEGGFTPEEVTQIGGGVIGLPFSCPTGLPVQFTVDILTDNFPNETSWRLINQCTGEVQLSEDRETLYIEPFTNYLSNFCVPDSRYSFVIEDEDPDKVRDATGLDCSSETNCTGVDGPGTYSVRYDVNSITLKGTESASGGGRFSTQIEDKKKSTKSKEVSAAFGIPFDDPTCQSPCRDATPITIGSTAQGTTTGGSPISSVQVTPACIGLSNVPVFVTAPTGAFYQVAGTGKSLVASTCATDFDSKISVYNSCDFSQESICEVANGFGGGSCRDIGGAQVAWPTNSGQVYYILVHGKDGETGEFDLSVAEVDDDESVCESAATLGLGASVNGTTIGGPTVTGGFSCTFFIFPGVSVAWYKVIGTGNELRATLTYASGSFNGELALISLFNSCGDIASSCVEAFDENFGVSGSELFTRIDWQSILNEEYYLMVHGPIGFAGSFELSLSITPP